MNPSGIRIDKWLWMVRVYKTRTMATDACNAGKIKMNGDNVKPSKIVKMGEIYAIKLDQLDKSIQVLDFPKSRVGAPLVPNFYTDLTTPEGDERVKSLRTGYEIRDHGDGRPTKRDRRQIDYLKDYFGND